MRRLCRFAAFCCSLVLSLLVSSNSSSALQRQASRSRVNASTPTIPAAPNQWAWVSGSLLVNQKSVPGTMGTPSATSMPGGTWKASTWVDNSGNLWLFGGEGWLTNQMWQYSPSTNQWTWMGGDPASSQGPGINDFQTVGGVYGTQGVPSPYNTPGQRYGAVSWTDHDGNFWLFGGFGYIGTEFGDLNDLWKYDPSAKEWEWVSGSNKFACPRGTTNRCGVSGVYGTLGTPDAGNVPGGRDGASGFIDAAGNLWMFGGFGYGSGQVTEFSDGELNDLWKFNPTSNQWTWMGGPSSPGQVQSAVFGTKGVFAAGNMPGIFSKAASWTDNNGHFWVFGTYNGDTELWEYDVSLNEWAWIGGDITCTLTSNCTQITNYGNLGSPAPDNFPGPRQDSAAWTDRAGNLWMFGGNGGMNELWRFDVASKQWTWMGGIKVPANGTPPGSIYGTLGTPWPGNIPGVRTASATWTDTQGNLWLFGGQGLGIPDGPNSPTDGAVNDLWVYQPSVDPLPTTATPVISVPSGSYDTIQTVNISDSTHGTFIFYTTDGTEPTTSSTIYTGPINVAANQTVKAYAIASGCYDSETANAAYTITDAAYPPPTISMLSPAFIASPGASFTLTITGTGFTTSSTAYWGSSALPTQALSSTQLAAQVPATYLLSPGISSITVQNPTPGGGTSGKLQFEVDSPYSGGVPAPVFSPSSTDVAAGSVATFAVTLPSSATSASAQCLNLPDGAACSYSASTQKLSITTAGSTPHGTYQVTIVFTETLPITVGWLLPFLLSPLALPRKRVTNRWTILAAAAVLSIAAMSAGCSGGGGAPIPTQTPTHEVTRSGTVTLTVH